MNDALRIHPATKQTHRVAFAAALAAFLAVVLWMIGPYILSLFLGATAALVCQPFHRWLGKRMGPRAAASAASALVLLLVIAPLTGLSVLAVRQGIEIGRQMADIKEFSPRALTDELSRSVLIRSMIGDQTVVNEKVKAAIQAAGHFIGKGVLKVGTGAPMFILHLILALISFFFFLLDGRRFVSWMLGLNVLDREVQTRLAAAFRDTAISAVLAGLAAAASQAAMIALGFLLLDVPGAFLAGGLTFIFAWIPVLGTLPASLAGMLYLYAHGEWARMGMMLALALTAGVVDNLVRPLVLNGRADMHPLVGLVAIIGGIEMFGILGVFIGPIMAAMLLALLRIWPEGL